MKRKLYELSGLISGRFSTKYMGVPVNLTFETRGNKGQLVTDSQFIQDAIENDPKFGVFIHLKEAWDTDDAKEKATHSETDYPVQEFEVRPKRQKTRAEIYAENKAKSASKVNGKAEDGSRVVDEVKNINDATEWFKRELGLTFSDAGELTALCEKHNVRFPNYK